MRRRSLYCSLQLLIPCRYTLSKLDELVEAARGGDWEQAFSHALSLAGHPLAHHAAQNHFLSLIASDRFRSLSPSDADRLFAVFPQDQCEWICAAALQVAREGKTDDVVVALRALECGLRATERWSASLADLADSIAEREWEKAAEIVKGEAQGDEAKCARARAALLELQDRATSWEALFGADAETRDPSTPKLGGAAHRRTLSSAADLRARGGEAKADGEPGKSHEVEADGWGELDLPDDENDIPRTPSTPQPAPLLPLSQFLSTPLPLVALTLATTSHLPELHLLLSLHTRSLWPYRSQILECIPGWIDPTDYVDLLPAVDAQGAKETMWEDVLPWREEQDWSERVLDLVQPPSPSTDLPEYRSAAEVAAWYLSRVSSLVEGGYVDTALALVQHAAARGVEIPAGEAGGGLDEVGEELTLLAKAVYERPSRENGEEEEEDWSLERWRSLSPKQVIETYTSSSTPATIAQTLRSLVLPYLSVLEARLERRGEANPAGKMTGLLYDYILALPLSSSGLDLLRPIFEASKPTLPVSQRIVKSDTDLARLAIAVLYGAGKQGVTQGGAAVMSKIFECLPAFDGSSSTAEEGEDADLFDLASESTADLARPAGPASTAPPSPSPSPSVFFTALSLAPPTALSAHLDTLDLHLSQLESLLRYHSAPNTGLFWFLSSYRSEIAQRNWATRLARTAASNGAGADGDEGEFESADMWLELMEFMAEGTGVAGEEPSGTDEERIEKGLGRLFWKLGREEALKIFFGGVLGAGRFTLARSLLEPSSTSPPLEPQAVEDLVISASREFYDNAEEGNLHSGDMKMAFDCLSAAPQQTPRIRSERAFIEATSRLCSFRLDSRPGIPLTPIELRHAPDRLLYVSRLLSSNDSAYRHPEMVLELVRKLGYPEGGKEESRTLAMLSDAAVQAGDWTRASEMCDRAVKVVEGLRKKASRPAKEGQEERQRDADEAAEYAWKACFQLGKHEGWRDSQKRLQALGQALTLCPPERIQDILPTWTALEREVAQEALKKEQDEANGAKPGAAGGNAAEAAARAAAETAAAGAAKVANFLSAAAARAGSSPVPPESPRSGTPVKSPSSGTPQSAHFPTSAAAAGHLAHETAAAASYTLRRAAAFFGGDHSSNRPQSTSPARAARPITPLSPASSSASVTSPPPKARPPPQAPARSPSPPSRFASAFENLADHRPRPSPSSPPRAEGGFGGFGLRSGLSKGLTAGVGWLIGADEMLEEEKRYEEEQRRRQEAELRERQKEQVREARGEPAPVKQMSQPAKVQNRARQVPPASSTKPKGRTKLQAVRVPVEKKSEPPKSKDEDDWDACDGPVSIVLSLGPHDETSELMEWDKVEVPESATVLDALRHLRSEDGHAGMQIDMPWELDGSWWSEGGPLAVVDTNVLISHLALLREFVELAARLPPTSRPVLLVPHIVLLELDGLKTSSRSTDTYSNNGSAARARSSISTLARSATNWLLSELSGSRENGVVRGQRKAETLLPLDERGKPFGENNDSLVLDAALYQREQRAASRVILLTDDRNLQLRATVEHVEAFGIEAGQDATSLLDLLSRTVPPPGPSHPPSPPPRPREPSFSRYGGSSPVKTPRKRQSPPAPSPSYPSPSPSPSHFVPPSPAAPTQRRDPPTSVPLPTYHAMEAEAIDTPPLHSDLPPPPLVSVESPVDVFYNLSLLIGHFVALPLYRHAYQYLRATRPNEQHEWQPELGDWRYWSPAECAQRAKRWWEDGQVRELCRVGLEHASTAPLEPPVPPRAQAPPRQSTPGSSRWATPTTSAPLPAPAPTNQRVAPRRPKPSIDRQLSDLHSSLPTLVTYLSSAPPSLTTWSAPRWEVLLESTGTFLVAVLGGAVGGDVRGEVGTVVLEWVGDLGRLGIRVEVEL
ncbi:hypothetical protein NBRC10512_007349 [Rhodotorula toruloides]